ncbi:hypothetical protein [Methyloprofundus sp.]|uniref:hypothetical protein n=1 Tax=Methyloprofundus sp. TaxID=2020875 RepID=UPI003D115706
MALAQEDIEQIQALIIKSIQATPEVGNANVRYELELRERTTRVEEELKHQRELMLAGVAQMDRRFWIDALSKHAMSLTSDLSKLTSN